MLCHVDQRRALLRAHRDQAGQPDMNGLDYVEVADDGTTLLAYFIGKLPPQLTANRAELKKYVRVEGGRRVRGLQVLDVRPQVADQLGRDDYLVITLDQPGDFSTYRLRLVGVDGIDPRYDHADFTFKIDCPSDLDCALPAPCPPPELNEPDINYLAKDYSSFRQLLLDRLALIMPDWTERHVPDLGITLVELLAYVGDHLSYYQDAVATEAYLDTARQRISVRRHTRLVDYFLHEGCNARAWLALSLIGADTFDLDLGAASFVAILDPQQTQAREVISPDEFRQLPPDTFEVFEPMLRTTISLRAAHNEISFYTWGQRECCLPRGVTSASLLDGWELVEPPPAPGAASPQPAASTKPAATSQAPTTNADTPSFKRRLDLRAGDVLIFEEVIGPKTGNPADADPARRGAVRLTKVTLNTDPLVMTEVAGTQTNPDQPAPVYQQPTAVVDIEWQAEDALPFALCLSAVTAAPACLYLENVSVARGNVVLVDHGATVQPPEETGPVPLAHTQAQCDCEGQPSEVTYLPGRYRPELKGAGVTNRQRLPADNPPHNAWVSAKRLMLQDPRAALPQVQLSEVPAAPNTQGGLTPLFSWQDLTGPTGLVSRLLDRQDASAAVLRAKLPAKTQAELDQLKPGDTPLPGLLDDLRSDLTALLRTWEPRFDLLGSGPDDLHFVVEVDNESHAHLRFGDNNLGAQPPAGSDFYADYRVGNGSQGNLGAESISHIVINLNGASLHVRNPLPAAGGQDAEPMTDAKLFAPSSFRQRLERAVIADDYAQIALREFSATLQRAAARLAWTGSWYEADVALDPLNAESESAAMRRTVDHTLNQYRRMGHDLAVQAAGYVPLDIELSVCVQPDYLRGHVKAALLEVFSQRIRRDGRPGFFHPDQLTFGTSIYLSQIVAAAQAVAGVSSVQVTKLKRLFAPANHEIANGVLPLGPFEIAQLDNDPDFPEHGHLAIVLDGGR